MIYFLRAEKASATCDRGDIKIGTTRNLGLRLDQIARDIGHVPTVLAVMFGSYADEKVLHDRFAPLRSRGEWFLPGRDLLLLIETEGFPWDQAAEPRPIRLDLTPETHRLLRLVAADEEVSMAAFARDILDRFIRDEVHRRGIKT